jgi:hypothetical protein
MKHWLGGLKGRGALIAAFLIAMTGLLAGTASAVHDTGVFELDGNIVHNGTATYDWGNIFDATGASIPTGAVIQNTDFQKDSVNPDASYFTSNGAGVKDTQPISAWGCKTQSNPTAKDNILNAYVTLAQIPVNAPDNAGDVVLYLASERESNNGDSFAGFWLFRSAISCNSATGSFTGVHTNGDLLIVSNYTNGGGSQDVNLFEWENGSLVNLGNGGVCGASPLDHMCGIANASTIGTQWPPGNTTAPAGSTYGLISNTFVETGIDLTYELGSSIPCFAFFQAETRSSQQLTATLKDFTAGNFSNCSTSTATTPQTAAGATIPAGGLSIGAGSVQARDHAVVSVNGVGTPPPPTGAVKFFICGPIATGNCATGGNQVGTPSTGETLTASNPPTTPSSSFADSDPVTITSAGRYCFRGVYVPDAASQLPASSDPKSATDTATNECFVVNPVTPNLSTQASAGPVFVGAKINDTAHLTGTATKPDGSAADGQISFTAYGPDDCATVAFGPVTIDVHGDGFYGGAGTAAEFTPTAPGVYTWVASYNGSSPNTNGAGPGACPEPTEAVTVQQNQPTMSTAQSFVPNDSATVNATAGGNLAGSVQFTLYPGANCSGTALYTSSAVPVSGASPQTVYTSNTTPITTTSPTLSWKVSYTSTNPAQKNIPDSCTETSSLTINNG